MAREEVAERLGITADKVRDVESQAAAKLHRRWVAETAPSLRDDGRPGW